MGSSTIRYSPTDAYETFPQPLIFTGDLSTTSERFIALRSEFLKKYRIGLTAFYNDFHNKENGNKDVIHIRETLRKIDELVTECYGWSDIQLNHDFYEVDYLPENDRVRYTIHPEARKEVLKRLLQLNHERHAEEVAAGLHDKKGVKKEKKVVKGKASDGGLFGEGEFD